MRDYEGVLVFAPRLPEGLTGLTFSIRHRGKRLKVTTDGNEVTYTLSDHGSSIDLIHHGERLTLESGVPVTVPVPPAPVAPIVQQPVGRAPRPRKAY